MNSELIKLAAFNDEFIKLSQATGILKSIMKFLPKLTSLLKGFKSGAKLDKYVNTAKTIFDSKGKTGLKDFLLSFRDPRFVKNSKGFIESEKIIPHDVEMQGFLQRQIGDMVKRYSDITSNFAPNSTKASKVFQGLKNFIRTNVDELKSARYRKINLNESRFYRPEDFYTKGGQHYIKGFGIAPDRKIVSEVAFKDGKPILDDLILKRRIPAQLMQAQMAPAGMAGTTLLFGGSPKDAAVDYAKWSTPYGMAVQLPLDMLGMGKQLLF